MRRLTQMSDFGSLGAGYPPNKSLLFAAHYAWIRGLARGVHLLPLFMLSNCIIPSDITPRQQTAPVVDDVFPKPAANVPLLFDRAEEKRFTITITDDPDDLVSLRMFLDGDYERVLSTADGQTSNIPSNETGQRSANLFLSVLCGEQELIADEENHALEMYIVDAPFDDERSDQLKNRPIPGGSSTSVLWRIRCNQNPIGS